MPLTSKGQGHWPGHLRYLGEQLWRFWICCPHDFALSTRIGSGYGVQSFIQWGIVSSNGVQSYNLIWYHTGHSFRLSPCQDKSWVNLGFRLDWWIGTFYCAKPIRTIFFTTSQGVLQQQQLGWAKPSLVVGNALVDGLECALQSQRIGCHRVQNANSIYNLDTFGTCQGKNLKGDGQKLYQQFWE